MIASFSILTNHNLTHAVQVFLGFDADLLAILQRASPWLSFFTRYPLTPSVIRSDRFSSSSWDRDLLIRVFLVANPYSLSFSFNPTTRS